MRQRPIIVLIAEDDAEDRRLIREAWQEGRLANELRFVRHGEELMDYLLRRGQYVDAVSSPRPDLVLLDSDMAGSSGPEALAGIKAHPQLRRIPVVALTSRRDLATVNHCYEIGINSYIVKPLTFPKLVRVVTTLGKYWFEIVELPPECEGLPYGNS